MRYIVILLLAASTLHCTSSKDGYEPVSTTVQVINNSFYDMNVYVLRTGQRVRLGNVSGGDTRTLQIPAYMAEIGATLQFLADPVGGNRTPVTNQIDIVEGDQLQLVIPSY